MMGYIMLVLSIFFYTEYVGLINPIKINKLCGVGRYMLYTIVRQDCMEQFIYVGQ
jgi:hypothetical protein